MMSISEFESHQLAIDDIKVPDFDDRVGGCTREPAAVRVVDQLGHSRAMARKMKAKLRLRRP